MIEMTARKAFEAKFTRGSPDECWLWTAQVKKGGYGGFRFGRYQLAHHAAVILDGRDFPDGMCVDHKCRNRLCVNPSHLRVVTNRQNTLENSHGIAAINSAKEACKNGHDLTGENLIRRANGNRDCRSCTRMRYQRYSAKKKAIARLAMGLVECMERVKTEE